MENFSDILKALPLVFFWSAVLSFVPTVYYLLIKNPPILKAERLRDLGIIVIGQNREMRKAETRRVTTIALIYGVCVVFFSIIFIVNLQHHHAGVRPFDILSAMSLILFFFSVITYLPIAIYMMLKNPWRNREEGVCLTSIFIGYGVALLIFSLVFSLQWFRLHHIPFELKDLFRSVFIMLFSSLSIAYLPVCFYIFRKIANPYRQKKIHANTIFVIYSACFLIFATAFMINWVTDARSGIAPSAIDFAF